MTENKINLQRYAMHYGTYMGLYWIVKFIFFPLGLNNSFLLFLFIGLTLAVPFLGFHYTRTFRNKVCGGAITFMQSWAFMIFMYLFASLLTAVVHYIYFRYIDHGHVMDVYTNLIENAQSVPGFTEMIAQYQIPEAIKMIRSMSAIEITMQLLSQNMLYCSILSLITAPFVAKKKHSITS